MKIKVLMFTAVLVTAVFALGLASPASAQTYPDCTILSSTNEQLTCVNALLATCLATPAGSAQINCLTYVVAQMQAIALKMAEQQQNPTPAPTPVPPVWCHDFTINMGYAQSGNAEVGYLHTALDKQGISYAPDTGNAYSAGTAYAVSVFQGYYGIYQSGYVGEKTRGQLNVLYGCTPATVPYVLITLPNGGETLIQGQQYTIRWNSYGLGNVNVAASDPVTHAKYYLATVPSTTGYYVWTVGNYTLPLTSSAAVPGTLPVGYNWQIEIYTGANPDDVAVPHDYSNTTFSIIAPTGQTCTSWTYSAWGACTNGTQARTVISSLPTGCTGGTPVLSQTCTPVAVPAVTVASPNGGETWKQGETHIISWTSTALLSTDKINIWLNDYTNPANMVGSMIITNLPGNSTSYTWGIPSNATLGSNFKMEVSAFRGTATELSTDLSNSNFTIAAAQTAVPGGIESIGLYDPTTSIFYLRNTNTSGVADMTFGYGSPNGGWKPFAGDWNGDSTDTVGLFDSSTSIFHLRNSNIAGSAEMAFGFGTAGANWLPVAGDWDGNGTDTVGLYDSSTSTFHLRNSNTGGYADMSFVFGTAGAGWLPIAGDWNGDTKETIGLYNPTTSTFYLRNTNSAGNADISFGFGYTGVGLKPLAGDWNNDAIDTIGLYNPNNSVFELRNTNTAGYADITFGFGAGGIGWLPIAGDWNIATQNQPSITVTSPNGGETWRVGETHNITWRSYGLNADTKVKILLIDSGSSSSSLSLASNNSASSLRIIPIPTSIKPLDIQKTQGGATLPPVIIVENVSASAGTYSWSIPTTGIVYSDFYKIKIETTTPSVADVSDNIFSVDPAPAITVLSPNGGETWTQGNAYDIRWYAGGVGNVSIFLVPENGSNCLLTSTSASSGSWSYTLGTQCPDGTGRAISIGKYKILISGNISAVSVAPSRDLGWLEKLINLFIPTAYAQGSSTVSDISDNWFAIIAAGPAADLTVGFGQAVADWLPVVGDWNGDLTTTVGVYDPPSNFYLKNTNTTGVAETQFGYGQTGAGWVPVSGKWTAEQSGITIGLYDPTSSTFYLRNSNTTGNADTTFGFGTVGWKPIAGDWNKDGVDTIGLYDPASSTFYLKNGNATGYADLTFGFGSPGAGWLPIAGDWNGDGADTIGLYDPATSTFYLRNTNTTGLANISFSFGSPSSSWRPVAGDWDGDGTATIGLYDTLSSVFYLKNSNTYSAMIGNASFLASLSEAVNMMLQEILALIAGR